MTNNQEQNPYAAPSSSAPEPTRDTFTDFSNVYLTAGKWLGVFGINLIVPGVLGYGVVDQSGLIGVLIAIVLVFLVGGVVFSYRKGFAGPVMVGSLLVAGSQLFPVAQVLAGMFGILFAQSLGFVGGEFDGGPEVVGIGSGFIVTIVTGGLLILAATVIGILARVFTPDHWWKYKLLD